MIDPIESINDYISKADWRTNENANTGWSFSGMANNLAGKMMANYWLDEIFTAEEGAAHREGKLHIHDLGGLAPYCAGWNLRSFLEEGFTGVSGRIASKPPKHLDVAIGQMSNFLSVMSSEWMGASAFNGFDTYLAPYVRQDNLAYEEVKQNIQQFVFNCNVPNRAGFQSPFTNITLDINVPEDIKEDNPMVGGEYCDFTYGDLQEEVTLINLALVDVYMEGDADGRPFTFPIPTYSITKDFDWDSPVVNRIFDMTAKYGLPYFQNFINSDMNPADVRSMCPLTTDTKVLIRTSKGIFSREIGDIYNGYIKRGTPYEVYTPEGWCYGIPIKMPMTDVYAITLSNGVTIKMGKNHLQPTKDYGTLSAKDIKVGMYLPFNKNEINNNDLGEYNLGFIVGAYLGDGSHRQDIVTYSLNNTTKTSTADKLKSMWATLGYNVYQNDTSVSVQSGSYNIIKHFVKGDYGYEKEFTKVIYETSVDFKNGLIDGYMETDGSRDKRRIYTSSKKLSENMLELFAMLGLKAHISSTDTRDGRLADTPVYCISYPKRVSYGAYFCEDDDFNYYSVTKVENIGHQPGNLYCFEVNDSEHLFMLSNGLITHNCRLSLDLTELRAHSNTGLFGASDSTGSIGVVTLNMARLGYTHKNDYDGLLDELDGLLRLSSDILVKRREVVTKLLDKNFYPYTKHYLGTYDNHFSSIGINGMNELIRNFTNDSFDITSKEGEQLAYDIIMFIRKRLVDFQEETGNLYNLEYTPSEGATYRFAKEDQKRFSNIIQAGTPEEPYYTNSALVPVNYTEDVFEALDINDRLQTLATGGTVFHVYSGDSIKTGRVAKRLIKTICENYNLPFLSITPTYSICPAHGYIAGEHFECPTCGKKTEVWTRVMGYFRPVQSFNIGKRGEFAERDYYSVL
jgi:ribonucleoside-triphosphate reductase